MSTSRKEPTIPILDLSPQIDALWDELNDAVQRVMRSGRFIMGPEVEVFEREAAAYLGVEHAVGVNSGTDALVIGLRALGIGPGDEVITTPFSFFATAESISNIGARPVFVDIAETSFNIDPSKIEQAITPKTKAIMPVHLYGRPAAMALIMQVAAAHDLKVVEDCAQSFGARYAGRCEESEGTYSETSRQSLAGRQTGTIGHVGAFSFFPTKNLGAFGDGGLLVTNNDNVADAARKLRAHGSLKKYHNEMLGYNSRLDAIQAAVLRVKLPYIDTWNRQRVEAALRYERLLSSVEGIVAPRVVPGHIFHQYTVRLVDANRDSVRGTLEKQGIGTMVYYPVPQDLLPLYRGRYPAHDTSDSLSKQVLSLPIWPGIREEVQERVVDALRQALRA